MLKLLKSVPEVMWVANSSLKNGANSLFAQKRSFFLEGVCVGSPSGLVASRWHFMN